VDGRNDFLAPSAAFLYVLLAPPSAVVHSDNLMAIFYKITHEEAGTFDLIPEGAEYRRAQPVVKKESLATDRWTTEHRRTELNF